MTPYAGLCEDSLKTRPPSGSCYLSFLCILLLQTNYHHPRKSTSGASLGPESPVSRIFQHLVSFQTNRKLGFTKIRQSSRFKTFCLFLKKEIDLVCV